MNKIRNAFTVLELLIVIIFIGILGIPCLLLSIYGLIVAFQCNVWIGLISLVVEPAPLIVGFAQFFFKYNIPEHIIASLK